MKWQNKHQKLSGIMSIIGSFCGELCVGANYLWGAISIYVVSYFRQYEPDITTRDLLLYIPIWGFYEIILYPLSTYLKDKFSARLPIGIGVLVFTGCFIGCAYTKSTILFIFLWSTAMGFIDGMCYVTNLAHTIQHFPHHKSLVGGIILAAVGISSFIFSFVALAIVNPQNKSPDIEISHGQADDKYYSSDVYDNVPRMFIVFAIIFLIIGTTALVLSTNPPPSPSADIGKEKAFPEKRSSVVVTPEQDFSSNSNVTERILVDNENKAQRDYDLFRLLAFQEPNESILDASSAPNGSHVAHNPITSPLPQSPNIEDVDECPSIARGLKTYIFWIFIIMAALPRTVSYFFSMCYKELGNNYDYNDAFLTLVGGLYSLTYGIARILWGWLSPKLGFNLMNSIIIIGMVVSSILLVCLGKYPLIFLLSVVSCALFSCGNAVLYPPKSCEIFGQRFGSRMYSFICGGFALGGILLYVGNLFLVPILGLIYFLCIAAGLLLFNILFGFKCLVKPKWKQLMY